MVYFVSDGTYTKIGKTNNPLKRLETLQTSNASSLKFIYLFDCNDNYEKRLHKLLEEYKTRSSSEWFNLKNINLYSYLKKLNNPLFLDLKRAEFKANNLNIQFYRGEIFDHKEKKQIQNELYNKKNNALKLKRKCVINDIIEILEHQPKKVISYAEFIKKYGFSKNEISWFIRGAKLSKKVFEHNERILGK